MSDSNEVTVNKDNRSTVDLRESIRRAFPEEPYTGKVTPNDREWEPEFNERNAILDDDKAVYEALRGRRWTDVSESLFKQQPSALSLLTDEAFLAFLPAWLDRSLMNPDEENETRDFLVYEFSPQGDMVPDLTSFKLHRIHLLSAEQRGTVRSILSEFTRRGTSPFVADLAAKAVALFDTLK